MWAPTCGPLFKTNQFVAKNKPPPQRKPKPHPRTRMLRRRIAFSISRSGTPTEFSFQGRDSNVVQKVPVLVHFSLSFDEKQVQGQGEGSDQCKQTDCNEPHGTAPQQAD